jgi:pilus assembly protein CpaB
MNRQFGTTPHRQTEKLRVIIALVVFFIVFLVIAFVFTRFSASSAPTAVIVQHDEPAIRMEQVLVPVQQIEAGGQLDPAMFRLESRPQLGLSSRVAHSFEEIRGQYAKALLNAGEPLHLDSITPQRPINPLTASIPDGYRAVTIPVDITSAVEGWAVPGTRVDVVWQGKLRGEPSVTVIVQNAKILSANKNINPDGKQSEAAPSTVTVLVTAEDANKIQLARTAGTLTLSLRGDNDPGKGNFGGSMTLDSILNSSSDKKHQDKKEGVVKLRGANGVTEEFVLKDGKLVPLSQAQ